MDIDTFSLRCVDFRDVIREAVERCDVLLAVIGPKWVGKIRGGRRIDNPGDWVRLEIEAALIRKIPVIPVLVDGGKIPPETELPPSLGALPYRHFLTLDQGRDFHVHVDRLIADIEHYLQHPVSAPLKPELQPTARVSPSTPATSIIIPSKPKPIAPIATPEVITNSLGMKFVTIPAGTFVMGSQEWSDAKPHEVTITRPFRLGIYQVTQAEYRKLMGENPSWHSDKGGGRDQVKGLDTSRFPVERISWLDSVKLCNKLSQRAENRTEYVMTSTAKP